MKNFNVSADIVEVNRYDFVVEAETKEEADAKLRHFLLGNAPYPHDDTFNGVRCVDREAAMETRETESITVKE